jgi:hypothetical protein
VDDRLAREIVTFLEAEPRYFVEVLERFRTHEYRTLLLAWSRLREERRLARDPIGRYVLASGDGPRTSPRSAADPTG